MEMSIDVVVYLISSVVIIIAVGRFMRVFFEKRRTPLLVVALSYVLYYVFANLLFLLMNLPMLNMMVNLIMVFIISLNYESSMLKRLVATICCIALFFLIEILVILIMNIPIASVLIGLGYGDIMAIVAASLVTLLMTLLLEKFRNIRKSSVASPMFWVSAIFIPVSSTVLTMLILSTEGLSQIALVSVVVIVFAVNILTFYHHDSLSKAYEDKVQSILHTKEKEYYFSQCRLMQESLDRMKSFRHDIKIHLGTLIGFSIRNNTDEVTGYLNQLIGDVEESEVYSDTGNITFDSIINYKLRDASKNKIAVDIEISIPSDIEVEIADVVIIIGNLLDNALDAVERVDEKWIKLNIDYSKGAIFIKVDNPYDGEVLFKDGKDGDAESIISSKPGDGHGYGLKNIRKSVEKYDGQMKITYAKNVFSAGILLLGREGAVQ